MTDPTLTVLVSPAPPPLLTLETTTETMTYYSPEPLPTKAYLTNTKGVQRLPSLGERPHPGPAHLIPTLELPTLPPFRASFRPCVFPA